MATGKTERERAHCESFASKKSKGKTNCIPGIIIIKAHLCMEVLLRDGAQMLFLGTHQGIFR